MSNYFFNKIQDKCILCHVICDVVNLFIQMKRDDLNSMKRGMHLVTQPGFFYPNLHQRDYGW